MQASHRMKGSRRELPRSCCAHSDRPPERKGFAEDSPNRGPVLRTRAVHSLRSHDTIKKKLGRGCLRDRPDKAYQLTRDGHRSDLRQFAPMHEPAEAPMQPLLGSPTNGEDGGWKARLALLERSPHAWRVAIVPSGLY